MKIPSKTLTLFIFGLLILTVIEGGVLYFKFFKKTENVPENKIAQYTRNLKDKQCFIYDDIKKAPNQAVPDKEIYKTASRLRKLSAGTVKAGTMNIVYSGKIVKIDRDYHHLDFNLESVIYARRLILEGDNGDQNTFYFKTEEDIQAMLVYDASRNEVKKSAMFFDALKVGDSIELTQKIDLFKTTELPVVTITKTANET